MQLPEYQQPTRSGQPTAGRSDEALKEQARQFSAAIDEVLIEKATFHRDLSPIPVIGDAPPVAQPGRPPMSQGATDASVLMLAGGATTAMVGGTAAVLMYVSQYADPVVCAIVFGAPTALVFALGRLVRRVKETVEAAPATHHHHYTGNVVQDSRRISTTNRGVIANTRNQTR